MPDLGGGLGAQPSRGGRTTFAPERDALNVSYLEVQRLLCITGICFAAALFLLTFGLTNPTLTDERSLAHAEQTEEEAAAMQQPGIEMR